MKDEQYRFDITLLVASLIAGTVAWLIAVGIYHSFVGVWSRPVLIGILFFVLLAVVAPTILVTSRIKKGFDEEFLFLQSTGAIIAGLAVMGIVMFALATLFEWIYDHEFTAEKEPTSYIFLLDESSSMDGNDPALQRYAAVQDVMSSQPDTPYAVYCFANTVQMCRSMGLHRSGETVSGLELGDGTMLQMALEQILNDLESGTLSGGDVPLAVVLTDGYAGDMASVPDNLVKGYVAAGAHISTVGLGNYDRAILQELAYRTGGLHIGVKDAAVLASAMQSAVSGQAVRDLVSERSVTSNESLYAALRILFLMLLGALLAFCRAMACARMGANATIIIAGTVSALVGGVLMEFGPSVLPAWLCWLILWLLMSATPAFLPVRRHLFGVGYVTGYAYGGSSEKMQRQERGIQFK